MPAPDPQREIRGLRRRLLALACDLPPGALQATIQEPRKNRISKLLDGQRTLTPEELERIVMLFVSRITLIFGSDGFTPRRKRGSDARRIPHGQAYFPEPRP